MCRDDSHPSRSGHHRRNRGPAGGHPPAFDRTLYRDRDAAERGIDMLKYHRAVTTRFDTLAVRYPGDS
ncbi:hypothetical protein [Nocardia brevicatena]|uniref:hypothetical protein n=1 Tax=Nocardia brevicatena TaxID=37327 RepID=UPI0002F7CCD2|nr:hypothetical protein [Nocardia brevicatena]